MSKLIGAGSYGKIYTTGKYAVKVIPTSEFPSAAMEILVAKTCAHENIIKLHEIALEEGQIKLSMDYYSDGDLSKIIQTDLSCAVVVKLATDILRGLAHMHHLGFVHADLKPQNILIRKENGIPDMAVICDFGISVFVSHVHQSAALQTVTYRAPEIDDANYCTEMIDMWSFGCILLEMASGTPAVNYDNSRDDSAWYACKLMKVNTEGSRDERLLRLKSIKKIKNYIREIVIRPRFADNLQRFAELSESGVIDLIIQCLIPDRNKRTPAASALAVLKQPAEKPSQCIKTIGKSTRRTLKRSLELDSNDHILENCDTKSLSIAELFHTMGVDKYTSAYIGCCMSGNIQQCTTIIESKIQPGTVFDVVSKTSIAVTV